MRFQSNASPVCPRPPALPGLVGLLLALVKGIVVGSPDGGMEQLNKREKTIFKDL